MELDFERKLEKALEKATDKLKSRLATAQPPVGASQQGAGVDAGVRRRLIEETAYLIAERRGFQGGDPEQDWLEAEREVDHMLMQVLTRHETPEEPAPKKKKAAASAEKRA
ncbi:MAG TPA: DUF2934 domain-containing protein [Gammaproteobacteria bacterium]|nr:DUF2934 domain-containing protein [Gammaproteobacteria bacterium]